jgi:4'-phosphopantetheinyl transferase
VHEIEVLDARLDAPVAYRRPQAREIVRAELGRRLGASPEGIELVREADGKPRLAASPPPLHFNLSHSGARALLAFAALPVGVDLERSRPRRALDRIAARWFTASEHERLAALDGEDRLEAFYALWTAKEACVKATGEGLAALREVDVVGGGKTPITAIWTAPRLGFKRWRVQALGLGSGWAGAVAAPGCDWRASLRELGG